MNNIDIVKRTYNLLQDDISKRMYLDRLNYIISGDAGYISDIVMMTEIGQEIKCILHKHINENLVIFGAGCWGRWIKRNYPMFDWKCFVDNNKHGKVDGLSCLNVVEFMEKYSDAYIVISSKYFGDSIAEQLIESGVSKNKLLDLRDTFSKAEKEQYFDNFLPNSPDEVFVDCGAFDGQTTCNFINWCKNDYKKIYMLEPLKSEFDKCMAVSKEHNNTIAINKGVWNKSGLLSFNVAEDRTSSKIVSESEGEESIEVVSIDELGDKDISFIKMDIEGSELEALKGARETIRNYHPKLAICIYHKPEDIWEIPDFVYQCWPHYKLYVRHYSFTASETVLYFTC